MTTPLDHLIVGGGPAGLAHAFWSLRADPSRELAVLEAADRAGGWVHTLRRDGFTMELGPQALRPTDDLDAFVAAAGLEDVVEAADPAAAIRWIGRGGRLVRAPSGPGSFLTWPLMSLGGKLRLLREPFVRAAPDREESVAAFAARRFGKQTVPLVQAMVRGVFAGDAARLETSSAFPVLADAERKHGSVFAGMKALAKERRAARGGAPRPKRPPLVSFHGGLQTLTERLVAALGDRVRTGHPVARVAQSDTGWIVTLEDGREFTAAELTLACPARVAADLLSGVDADLAAELKGIPFASLAGVHVALDAAGATPSLAGFGGLLEPGEGREVLGLLFASAAFPSHAPEGQLLVRALLGGVDHPRTVERSDEELLELTERAIRDYTGYRGAVRPLHVGRVRDAIPQYVPGHGARLERIRSRVAGLSGLGLIGNSYDAIALTPQLRHP